jgi:hypothetical protein
VTGAAILAVDGGGSKLDAALLGPDGEALATVRVGAGRRGQPARPSGVALDGAGAARAAIERDREFA